MPPPVPLDRAVPLFAVPNEDLRALCMAAEEVCRDARLADWVARTAGDLRAAVGMPSPPPPLTSRPDADPDVVAYLPVLAFAEVLPTTLAWSQARGIPAAVVTATMQDVGRMLRRNRVWFAEPGLGDELAGWLTRHLVGAVHEVGCLQYERTREGPSSAAWLRSEGIRVGTSDPVVHLHVPEAGPLAHEAVRESLCAAQVFLHKRFPEERFASWSCISWLLDPQLADYLPVQSNIVRFQGLFRIGPAKDDDGDASVRKFVFGHITSPVEELPQRTSLERAVLRHWRNGGHWRVHIGRLDLSRA